MAKIEALEQIRNEAKHSRPVLEACHASVVFNNTSRADWNTLRSQLRSYIDVSGQTVHTQFFPGFDMPALPSFYAITKYSKSIPLPHYLPFPKGVGCRWNLLSAVTQYTETLLTPYIRAKLTWFRGLDYHFFWNLWADGSP